MSIRDCVWPVESKILTLWPLTYVCCPCLGGKQCLVSWCQTPASSVLPSLQGGGRGTYFQSKACLWGNPSPVLQDLQMTQIVNLGTYLSIVNGSRKLSTHQHIRMQEHSEMRQLNLSCFPSPFLS